MNDRYCYWSVATGPDADRMERCVRSARAVGVFRDFHVLTDRPIEVASISRTVRKGDRVP